MRRIPERILHRVRLARFDLPDFFPDALQRFAKAIQFLFRFALRRFDHERTRHGKRNGRRMKAVIHQALGHVALGNARASTERPQIQQKFVCALAKSPLVQHRIRLFEPRHHIVRIQDSQFRGPGKPFPAHHGDIRPGYDQNVCAAVRRCRHRPHRRRFVRRGGQRRGGQKRRKVLRHANRAHPRTAAAMRNAEGLVQIQVARVRPEIAGTTQAHLRIHIRPVKIHLSPAAVHDVDYFPDVFFEHAVRGRIRNHQRRQAIRMFFRRVAQRRHVHVARLVRLDHNHLHARQDGAGGIRPVGRFGDQANVAAGVSPGFVPGLDDEQARIFSRRPRIGLEKRTGKSGDLGKPASQFLDQLGVSQRLIRRNKGMRTAESRQRNRQQLRRRVQLHRARSEGYHAGGERQVSGGEALQVAHHFRFGTIPMENRMFHKRRGAAHRPRIGGRRLRGKRRRRYAVALACENMQERIHLLQAHGFVEGHAQRIVVVAAQIDAMPRSVPKNAFRVAAPRVYAQRVEEMVMPDAMPQTLQAVRQQGGEAVYPLGNGAKPVRPMIRRIHAGHNGGQHLRRANIGGRPGPPNVLLARLKRHSQGRIAVRVHRQTDNASGYPALERLGRGQIRGVRTAIPHGHPEPLRGSDGDVRPEVPRRRKQRQGKQIGRRRHMRLCPPGARAQVRIVVNRPVRARVLHEGAKRLVAECEGPPIPDRNRYAQRLCPGLHDPDRLGMTPGVHEENMRAALGRTPGQHRHGLGGGRRFVKQRSVGDGQAGQLRHRGLEIQQRLQPALRNFGLIGRILGVPVRIFQHVAPDYRRRRRIVIAHACVRPAKAIFVGEGLRFRKQVPFAERFGQIQRPVQADIRRNRAGDELVQRGTPHLFEHPANVFFRRPIVPRGKTVGRGKYGGHGWLRYAKRVNMNGLLCMSPGCATGSEIRDATGQAPRRRLSVRPFSCFAPARGHRIRRAATHRW